MQNPYPRNWDWPSAGLLVGITVSAAMRLASTKWADSLYFGENMAVAGAILGLWIGYARLGKLATRLVVMNYTLILVPWQISLLASNSLPLSERFYNLAPRFYAAWTAFINRQPSTDAIFFIVIISLGFWLAGLASGFALTRRRDLLGASLPSGLILLVVQYYDPEATSRIWFLAVYFFMTLTLMGRLYFLNHRETWQVQRVFQLPETARDLSNGLMLTSALVVLIAWTLPVSLSSWQAAEKFWKHLTQPLRPVQERVSDSLDPLNSDSSSSASSTEGQAQFQFEATSVNLGRGQPLSDTIVFRVDVPPDINVPRLYWRGRIFDFFDGLNWINTFAPVQTYDPTNADLLIGDLEKRQVATFNIRAFSKQSLIYAPAQTLWMSLPGRVLALPIPGRALDIFALEANPLINIGQAYQVRSALANPSVAEMRAAGTEYPGWVKARYLQLPSTFPLRIQGLAAQITEGQSNPYDRATAITNWLRTNIAYQPTVPATPPGQETLEWILFTYKRGYCTYYASAEVVMLRSLGIPARLAVGFSEGELDEEANSYTVRAKDYHAWPEVYFPGIGWVEFEPTAGQPELPRPLTSESFALPLIAASPPTPLPTPEVGPEPSQTEIVGTPWYLTYRMALNWILTMLVLAMLWLYNLHSGWVTKIPRYLEARATRTGSNPPRWIHAWAAWTRLSRMERSFEAVNFSLRSFGERMPVHTSAGERAKVLTRLLPTARAQVQLLTELHEAALFGRGGESDYPNRGAVLRGGRGAARLILLHTIWARLIKWWQSILYFLGV